MDRGKSGRCMRGEGKYDCEKPHDENKVIEMDNGEVGNSL